MRERERERVRGEGECGVSRRMMAKWEPFCGAAVNPVMPRSVVSELLRPNPTVLTAIMILDYFTTI